MRNRRKHGLPTGTITLRIPKLKIARLQREAAGALMSVSAYAEALLEADEPERCPCLAALARIVAIHQIAEASETIAPEQLRELKRLVLQLAQAAHREADAFL